MKDATYSTCNATSAPRRSPSPGAARVTGLDLSLKSLEEARQIAADAEQDVDYVHANVYDAVDALQGRQFDVVYTGKGALCYLPDLQQWAKVVHELLKPGGALYLVEFHPLLTALREVSLPGESDDLTLRADYLEGRGAIAHDSTVSYTGDEVPGRQRSYEWHHGLGEIVTSLVGEGLHVTTLRESEVLPGHAGPPCSKRRKAGGDYRTMRPGSLTVRAQGNQAGVTRPRSAVAETLLDPGPVDALLFEPDAFPEPIGDQV